jgi:UDP-N-acetylglucosamine 2-epimerase (non-hydrolysing)
MPEEFNRVVADELSDVFFVTEPSGLNHLLAEGKEKSKIHQVGNTMIDTMVAYELEIEASNILELLEVNRHPFLLMTMHRPATVDNKEELSKLIMLIEAVSAKYKIVFPVHPRTIKNAKEFNLFERLNKVQNLVMTEPLDYFAFQKLVKHCRFIITDSGGIQEESTFRKKPCLTLRPNTERPVTVDLGTNTLVPFDVNLILEYIASIENNSYKTGSIPQHWDGASTQRILSIISNL